jgi:glycosyltransferase EpsE
MLSNKKVSVIMGVYNCDDTLEEAINSILKQTYANWELIVCDDSSTDNTYAILQKYKKRYPDKIILLRNVENCKLAYTLNHCLKYVNGYYIARMDGDDISLPDRFEKQVAYLEQNPNVDLVGTSMQRFDGKNLADVLYAVEKPDKYTLKDRTPFNHATIMTYKYVYDELNGYTVATRTERVEDYDLWFRFFNKGFQGANITKPLYLVRENENAIKRRTFKARLNGYKTTIYGYRLLNFPLHWYIKPAVKMAVKCIIPSKFVLIYRKYQKIRFNYGNEKKVHIRNE